MSTTNAFSSGTTISSSAVNANFSDIASEITNSLPRDGQAAMTAALPITSGSAAAPGLTFSGDTNTGLFRKSADTLGFAAGGTEVANATATTYTISVTLSATDASLVTPTIAGATFSGTLSGTPTFSGAVNFSGVPVFADGFSVSAGATTIPTLNIENADTTITRASAGVIAVEGSNVLLASGLAAQSDQETGTSTTKIVTSGVQKHHPLHPKAWGLIAAGASPSVTTGSGISSVTRPSTGIYEITLTTAMSSNNYAVHVTPESSAEIRVYISSSTRSTTTFRIVCLDSSGTATNSASHLHVTVMGDQ